MRSLVTSTDAIVARSASLNVLGDDRQRLEINKNSKQNKVDLPAFGADNSLPLVVCRRRRRFVWRRVGVELQRRRERDATRVARLMMADGKDKVSLLGADSQLSLAFVGVPIVFVVIIITFVIALVTLVVMLDAFVALVAVGSRRRRSAVRIVDLEHVDIGGAPTTASACRRRRRRCVLATRADDDDALSRTGGHVHGGHVLERRCEFTKTHDQQRSGRVSIAQLMSRNFH